MAFNLGCTIADTFGALTPTLGFQVVPGSVTARASQTPLFLQQTDGSWLELANQSMSVTDVGNGSWSLELPSASQCDPTSVTWSLTLPDGTAWSGAVTDQMVTASQTKALSIHDLKTNWGWGLVHGGAGGAVSAVGVSLASPSSAGTVEVDASPPSGGGPPVAYTVAGLRTEPPATANRGLLSVGPGPWDGTSAGHFLGSGGGTLLAVCGDVNLAGAMVDVQYNGQSIFALAGGALALGLATTTVAPAPGSAGVLPAAPAGYLRVTVAGTPRLIPYY